MSNQAILPKRYFRNHYMCERCPNEWHEGMVVVTAAYCPCCDELTEPYASDALFDPEYDGSDECGYSHLESENIG